MRANSSLVSKIRLKKASVTVLGLGHIGLPAALLFARSGFKVTGADIDVRKIEELEDGTCYIQEPGLQEILLKSLQSGTFRATTDISGSIAESDVVSVCVPTPVENGRPDLRPFQAAISAIKAGAHKGMAIVIESTLPPSTTAKVVAPELESLGYEIDKDIFLAYCPERLMPTHALEEIMSNTRIIGGVGPESGEIAAELFRSICKSVLVTSALTAELVKVAENTFRDLNIAYANLLALIAERLGTDVNDVIKLANTHPRVGIHRPGLGVGGPCLPKDPYMLIQDGPADLVQLISLGRKINEKMSTHTVDLLTQTLTDKGMSILGAKVAVLGVTYKPDTEDVTNTPAKPIIQELLRLGASVSTYDPYSPETYGSEGASSCDDALRDADCVVVVTGHTQFKSIDPQLLRRLVKPHCIVLDGPRLLDPTIVRELGFTYLSIGYAVDRGSCGAPST
jgi:UDP-N-acetyl-D-mannosaminuronic acid dehydrogenase